MTSYGRNVQTHQPIRAHTCTVGSFVGISPAFMTSHMFLPSILSLSLKKTEVPVWLFLAHLVLSYWMHTFCWGDWSSLPYCTSLCPVRWDCLCLSGYITEVQLTVWCKQVKALIFWKSPYQGMGDSKMQCLCLEYSFMLPITHPLCVRSCSTRYRGHSGQHTVWALREKRVWC